MIPKSEVDFTNRDNVKSRYQFLCQLETDFETQLQQEIKHLQNNCPHQAIASDEHFGDEGGIECQDCGFLLLDPYGNNWVE